MKFQFFADGEPAPGGSKTAYALTDKDGKLIIKTNESGRQRPVLMYSDDGKGNKAWRKIVGWRAKSAMQHAKLQPFAGALRLSVEFLMPRGKTVTREHHTVKPDLSKLLRSTEDAMTGIVWIDDAIITEHGPMKKRYAKPGEATGAHITVETIEDAPLELDFTTPGHKPFVHRPPAEPELEDSPFR